MDRGFASKFESFGGLAIGDCLYFETFTHFLGIK